MKYASLLSLFCIACLYCSSQISDSIGDIKFGPFDISSGKKTIEGKGYLIFRVTRQNEVVLTDSVITDKKMCTGFSVPGKQPIPGYFIFCKRERKKGRIYILTKTGDVQAIAGGGFWAAPKHKLLFILAERDYTNLLIYDLNRMKTVLEKYNCDEFSAWYYSRPNYIGKVLEECGDETESQHEISGIVSQVLAEQFDPKSMTLNEIHTSDEDLENAKALVKYAGCK